MLLERNGLVALSAGERARVVHPTMESLVGQISAAARHFLATSAGEKSLQEARRVFEAGIARHAARSPLMAKSRILRKRLPPTGQRWAM